MLNPTTPFLIRARDGAKTELWVKYDFGQEEATKRSCLLFFPTTPDKSSLFIFPFFYFLKDAEPG